jgi:hypothetical protein
MMRSSVVLPQPEGPEQRGQFAVRELQRDVVERRELAELLADVLDFDRHAQCSVVAASARMDWCRRHSIKDLTASVTSASSASSDAIANAAVKLYSL